MKTQTSATPSFEIWGTDIVSVDPIAEDYKKHHSQQQSDNSSTSSATTSSRSQAGSLCDSDNITNSIQVSTHSNSTAAPSSSTKLARNSWISLSSFRMNRSPPSKPSLATGTTSYNMSGLEESKRKQELAKQLKLDQEAELHNDPKALWRKREEENSHSELDTNRVSIRKSPSIFRSYMGSLLGVGRGGNATVGASQSSQPISLA